MTLATVWLTGCATSAAPDYQATPDQVAQLKKSGASPAHVGLITARVDLPGARLLNLRTQSMRSPTGFDFGDYVAAALRSELQAAQLNDSASATEITGTLVQNQLDTQSADYNSGAIEVRFMVTRGPWLVFDKVKSVTYQWPSAADHAAATASAKQGYTAMVNTLMASLIADPGFIAALTEPSSSRAASSSAK